MPNRREFLFELAGTAAVGGGAAAQDRPPRIRQIDIIHHTHTDVGYTDMPSVVRDRQKRYLDAAIDLCDGDRNYRWTVESLIGLDDWWRTADKARRDTLLRLVREGRMDVMGLPLNQTAFMNALEWRQMMSWIPADVWRAVNPRAAMQNDVNGFPRAGAVALLDRGVRHLLMGINSDSGGPPFQRPSAFWWKMPDGRRLFVWLGEHYGRAMAYLSAPRQGFDTGEQAVRKAHAACADRLRKLEADGYPFDRLILTFTHPAGYDNGWPYATLGRFIAEWNRLGLEPALRFTTATEAVLEMEKKVGAGIPVLEGEWTDWWANGNASGPREVTASRWAKRYLAAALSPAWGPMPAEAGASIEGILRDLCLFDEHTWGASSSISAPYSMNTLGQYVEKSELAYRPMGQAQWLLARRARTRIEPLADGVYVVNPAPAEFSGWAAVSGLPAGSASLVDPATGAGTEIERERGRARFWVEKLGAHSMRTLRAGASKAAAPASGNPSVKTDASGWPVAALWPGMRRPLFEGSLGEFVHVGLVPPADRRTITQLHAAPEEAKRAAIRKKALVESAAAYGSARAGESPHTLTYAQEIRHARIARASRTVELWKREPRARISVRFDRLPSTDPELLYIAFALPQGAPLPVFSSGDMPFTPYRDQLKGSCRDYFAIDGWAHYATPDGDWLWVTRDAPLAVVGGPHALERHQSEPPDRHRILAMVFDNCWHTNFVADSHGTMEFQFELAWREKIAKPGDLAEALAAEPVVLVNAGMRESPAVIRNLFRP